MSYTILVVDDSATTRALIRRTLKISGLPLSDIYEAGNGREALELLDCLKVDLVLADLNMPEMDGFEMTRRILDAPATRDIPVILVSAEPNAAQFAEHRTGIKGLIRKPFTPEGVRNLISETLGVPNA